MVKYFSLYIYVHFDSVVSVIPCISNGGLNGTYGNFTEKEIGGIGVKGFFGNDMKENDNSINGRDLRLT